MPKLVVLLEHVVRGCVHDRLCTETASAIDDAGDSMDMDTLPVVVENH